MNAKTSAGADADDDACADASADVGANANASADTSPDANAYAIFINFYEPMRLETPDGIVITIESEYPYSPGVHIKTERLCGKRLFLRIPEWSTRTGVKAGLSEAVPVAGIFYEVPAEDGAVISLTLDFKPRYLQGELSRAGKSSLYIGPILFAWDNAMNPLYDFDSLPELSKSDIEKAIIKKADGRLELHISDIRLVDFYHAVDDDAG